MFRIIDQNRHQRLVDMRPRVLRFRRMVGGFAAPDASRFVPARRLPVIDLR